MKKLSYNLKALAFLLLTSVVFASNAQAVLIDFEDGVSGNSVGSFYAAQGVEFSNATWNGVGSTLPGMSGVLGVTAPGTFQFFQDNAVVATFPNGVSTVSLVGADVGANGLRIDAYDAVSGGTLIDFDEAYGTNAGVGQYFLVQADAQSIRRIELYQIANNVSGEGIVLDDLQFDSIPLTPVPTLSTWSLIILTLSMIFLGYAGLRRRQH